MEKYLANSVFSEHTDQRKSCEAENLLHKWRAEKDRRNSLVTPVWQLIEFIRENLYAGLVLCGCKMKWIFYVWFAGAKELHRVEGGRGSHEY